MRRGAAHGLSRNSRHLRPQRGNPVTKSDASPAKLRKSLRRQIGRIYDDSEIGNSDEPASCYKFTGRGDAPFVEFHVTPHTRHGFPVGQLCHYTLDSNATEGDEPPERLTLGFPTADVVLFGARLAVLVEKLHTQSLTAVMTLDARYAHALGQNPWVARIVVSRIDKQGTQ